MAVALCVHVRAKPGDREALRERLGRHAAFCLAHEPGCRRFDVMTRADDADGFVLFEVYDDEAALAAHDASSHMAAFRAEAGPLISERTRITGELI
ncbi:MAG: putative quinol monooxygenase [Hyphomicrobiales bacterium]|nr:putative quinol monooxygenase [Hyphomicrobiales bacterium]